MRGFLKRLLRQGRTALSPALDYKSAWNRWAVTDAHDAILTGASPEEFERTGQGDADLLGRYLRGGEVVLNLGCGVGRVDKDLAPRVRELHAIDVSGDMIHGPASASPPGPGGRDLRRRQEDSVLTLPACYPF